MPDSYYRVGTITVANGATTASGLGTAFKSQAKAGDLFLAWDDSSAGSATIAANPTDNQVLSFEASYVGPSLTDATTYLILHVGTGWTLKDTLAAAITAWIDAQQGVQAAAQAQRVNLTRIYEVYG